MPPSFAERKLRTSLRFSIGNEPTITLPVVKNKVIFPVILGPPEAPTTRRCLSQFSSSSHLYFLPFRVVTP